MKSRKTNKEVLMQVQYSEWSHPERMCDYRTGSDAIEAHIFSPVDPRYNVPR